MDYHLNYTRLFGFIDQVSSPNTKDPLANVEPPINDRPPRFRTGFSTYCDYNYLDYYGSATMYLLANNTAFTNLQQVPHSSACLRGCGWGNRFQQAATASTNSGMHVISGPTLGNYAAVSVLCACRCASLAIALQ